MSADRTGPAEHLTVLGRFCGPRDLPRLDRREVVGRLSRPADVAVLFGGSVLAGADEFATAVREGVAERFVVVGGRGHTTAALETRMRRALPGADPRGATEADMFAAYLRDRHGVHVDLLERESTNCGTNVENCLRLLAEHGIGTGSIVLVQDATMQRRMDAGFRRWLGPDAKLLNFAAYATDVVARDGRLAFADEVHGMWDLDHYVSLLLGEIPRLRDDAAGYGPRGRGYIAHVDIPDEVVAAFDAVRAAFGEDMVRRADPRWGSPAPTA